MGHLTRQTGTFKTIGDLLPEVVAMVLRAKASPKRANRCWLLPDKQDSQSAPNHSFGVAPQGADLGTHAVGRGGNHVTRGFCVQGSFSPKGLTVPALHLRNIRDDYHPASFYIDQADAFLYIWRIEVALPLPGSKA